jgi:hypothetical protein
MLIKKIFIIPLLMHLMMKLIKNYFLLMVLEVMERPGMPAAAILP